MADYLFDRRKNVFLQSLTMSSVFNVDPEDMKLFKQLCKKIEEEEEDALIRYRAIYYLNWLESAGEKV